MPLLADDHLQKPKSRQEKLQILFTSSVILVLLYHFLYNIQHIGLEKKFVQVFPYDVTEKSK